MIDRVREQKLKSRAKKFETMRKNDGGDELLMDDKIVLGICPDLISDDEFLELRKKHFGDSVDSEGVNDSSLQQYIFEELVLQTKRATTKKR